MRWKNRRSSEFETDKGMCSIDGVGEWYVSAGEGQRMGCSEQRFGVTYEGRLLGERCREGGDGSGLLMRMGGERERKGVRLGFARVDS